jgi:hypothetical protein
LASSNSASAGTTIASPAAAWDSLPAIRTDGDIYKFENIGTGRCLEARNGAVNGGAVDLWPCESGESNERWYWPPSATPGGSPFPGPKPIQTRVSGSTGFCLDVPGAQITPGLQLQTWRCNGTLAQQFWVAQ